MQHHAAASPMLQSSPKQLKFSKLGNKLHGLPPMTPQVQFDWCWSPADVPLCNDDNDVHINVPQTRHSPCSQRGSSPSVHASRGKRFTSPCVPLCRFVSCMLTILYSCSHWLASYLDNYQIFIKIHWTDILTIFRSNKDGIKIPTWRDRPSLSQKTSLWVQIGRIPPLHFCF